QDSKYIDARGGRLRDFEMNKICAAGTGSFLEEQAERLGIQIVGEFARLALQGARPRDLGTRCTVFMDAELVRAQAEGAPIGDLCAGLAYSVARNYLEKVVAGRRVGRTVVFQGGTASNGAVVSAFNALLGRPVSVHPFNRLSGAIGMALLCEREMRRSRRASSFRGLASCREHRVRTFECRGCENRCEVSRVEAGGRVAHFGDVCEKYTAKDRGAERRPARGGQGALQTGTLPPARETQRGHAPDRLGKPAGLDSRESLAPGEGPADLFARRAELLREHLPPQRPERRPRVGLVQASLGLELLPLFAHLLDQLGFEPVLSGATTASHLARGAAGLPPEVCLPLKVAHGHLRELLFDRGLERVLMPTVLEFPKAHSGDRPFSCLFAQELPDMAALGAPGRVLTPQLVLGGAAPSILETLWELASSLDVAPSAAERALAFALERQQEFDRARREEGRRLLDGPLPGGRAVVVLGKPYNLHDPYANLNLAKHLGRLGLTAIPMDMVPIEGSPLPDGWYQVPWHFNREQVRVLTSLGNLEGVFPLLVSNFGCGPDSFATKHLERLLGDRPRLFLEFDEHRGEAGLITRLEAFADEVEEALAEGRAEPLRPRVLRNSPTRSRHRVRRVFVPGFEGHSHVFAGLLRSKGLEVEVLGPPDEESARLGEEFSSGRECHPYSLLAGEMVRLVRSGRVRDGDAFMAPGTRLPCLLPQYGDGWRMVRDQLGAPLEIWDPHVAEMKEFLGLHGVGCLYGGLTVVDQLIIAACRRRPWEVVPGSVDLAIEDCYKDLEDTLARRRAKGYEVVEELTECVRRSMARLGRVPLGPESPRPLVGVTGDLYTRINAIGNGGLFARLESLGCTVWPSPFFGATADFEAPQNARRKAARGEGLDVCKEYALAILQLGFRESLISALDEDLRPYCEEPSSAELQSAAQAFFGADTNHLVRGIVGKMVTFARRGVHGVISAAGLNCMVGVSAAATVPAIRSANNGIPVVALFYGSHEGPSHRIALETFVHQVHERFHRLSRAD
ncbi:MAG: acyl-CoA dehydratase activase-related protein, partial [Polyangia bacterium]|nr:acyl-CoA dehydratase activase-related protein [Polyangia bacterium]